MDRFESNLETLNEAYKYTILHHHQSRARKPAVLDSDGQAQGPEAR